MWTVVRMEDGGERDGVWTGVDGVEDGRWRGARRGVDRCGLGEDGRWRGWKMEGSETRCGWVWTWVRMEDGGEPEGAKYSGKLRLKGLQMDMIVREKKWTEVVDEACFRVSLKHASLRSEIFKKIGVEGDADGHLLGEKGVVVGGQRSCTKHVSGLV